MSDASPRRLDERADAAGGCWDEALPDREQRNAPRFTLLIRTAKLIGRSGEYLCIVRDVSREGLKVRTFHALPRDQDFAIQFASGESHPVARVWQQENLVGFRFGATVPLERLLAEAPDGLRKRAVRLRLELPLALHANGRQLCATFVDISQHGACIRCDDHLAMGERIGLSCDLLPELTARVRWRRTPYHGLIFEQSFRFDELARLTASLQTPPPSRLSRLRAAS